MFRDETSWIAFFTSLSYIVQSSTKYVDSALIQLNNSCNWYQDYQIITIKDDDYFKLPTLNPKSGEIKVGQFESSTPPETLRFRMHFLDLILPESAGLVALVFSHIWRLPARFNADELWLDSCYVFDALIDVHKQLLGQTNNKCMPKSTSCRPRTPWISISESRSAAQNFSKTLTAPTACSIRFKGMGQFEQGGGSLEYFHLIYWPTVRDILYKRTQSCRETTHVNTMIRPCDPGWTHKSISDLSKLQEALSFTEDWHVMMRVSFRQSEELRINRTVK